MTAMMQDSEVVFLLLLMPLVRTATKSPQLPFRPPAGPYAKLDPTGPEPHKAWDNRKGKGRGKSAGKFDYSELKGLTTRTQDNHPICFAFNTNGCTNAVVQNRCSKGVRVCMKCFDKHSQRACPKN